MFLTELLYSMKYDPSLRLKLSIIFFCIIGFLDCITSLPIGLYGILVGGLNTPNADEQQDHCNHELLLNLIIGLGFLDMIGAALSLSFSSILIIMGYKFFYDPNANEQPESQVADSVREYGHFNQESSESIEDVHNSTPEDPELQNRKLELLMKGNEKLSAKLHNSLLYVGISRILFSFVFFVLSCIVSEMIFQMSDSCRRDNPFLYDTSATFMILRWIIYVFSFVLLIPLCIGFWNLVLSNSESLLIKTIRKQLKKCKHGMMNIRNYLFGVESGGNDHRHSVRTEDNQYFTTNQYHNGDEL